MRAAILLVSALALAACSREAGARDNDDPAPSGVNTSRNFPVGEFTKLALRGGHDVIVTVGGAPSVRAEGDSGLIERLEIKVEGDELVIGSKHRRRWFGGSHDDGRAKVVVHVTVPSLAAASIDGSGDLRVDKVQGESFKAAIAGSGDMQIGDLRVRRSDFSIAGSGGITAKGTTESSDVSIAGSGDVDISGLASKT